MAVYMGDKREEHACWTAMRINRAMQSIIRPEMLKQYPDVAYTPQHTVGIDSSDVLVVKDGVRGDNDLIWVGRAANYAAKLCVLDHAWQTRITEAIYQELPAELLWTVDGTAAWEAVSWTEMNDMRIYRSSCLATGL